MRRFGLLLPAVLFLGACSSGGDDDGGPGPVNVASVEISPNPAEVVVPSPGSLQLTATAKDASGNVLQRTITWSTTGGASVNPTTGNTTTLTASGPGSVTATSEGVSSTAVPVTVRTVVAPIVSSIAPATLIPGGVATIAGANFSTIPANNTVTIAGVAASVTAANAGELTVQLPAAGGFPCEPSRNVDVQVTVGGASGSRQHPLQVATQRALAVGERLLFGTDTRCNELSQTGGRYIVAVYNNFVSNTSINAPPANPVELRGGQGIATQDPIPAVPTLAATAASYFAPSWEVSPLAVANAFGEIAAARRADEKHIKFLEANTRLLTEALPTLRKQYNDARSGARASSGVSASPSVPNTIRRAVNPTLGANNTIRVPDINSGSFCNTFIEITARTVYAGSRAIILADIANPDAGDMSTVWNAVGQEFDNNMFPILQTNFGNPLAMDPATDNDQRIVMVFSNAVNNLGGVAGFVVSCDFLPRTHVYQGGGGNNSSNFGEFFYAIVPVNQNPNGAGSKSQWFSTMRSTIIHEVKHITSFAERISRNALSFELAALEEGTARHSEELWARQVIYNQPWKGDITYANSLFCDVRTDGQQGATQCIGKPFAVFRHFQTLYTFLTSPETFTPMGRVASGDFNFYASMWSFVRWAIDNHAATEPAFLGGMTQSATLAGMPNIAAQTGRPVDEMLGDWALALFLDNYPGFTQAAGQKTSILTWNFRDQFAGMNTDFCAAQQLFCRVFPLEPRQVAFGANYTSGSVDVRGGSAAYFELSGTQTGKQLLHVRTPGGGDPAAVIRVAVARIQ
ncbi:MAG TPA: IPT/TIG domain-containing protein [Gemmatimonadaceae bacterium]|nr:IPT/TIG domain-containing protein [Gemmatimonadaceae bacterium]